MKSVAATAAAGTLLQQLLLLLESPGAVVAQGPSPGRASDSVVTKDSRPAAELDRSILLEWRASSPHLQQVWSDEKTPVSAWEGVTVGARGRAVKIEFDQDRMLSAISPGCQRRSGGSPRWRC